MVAAVSDCADLDPELDDNVFAWPGQLDLDSMVNVAGTSAGPVREVESMDGPFVEIAAPRDGIVGLAFDEETLNCTGTSYGAPMVTGTLGLMIAANSGLRGDPTELIDRLKCSALEDVVLAGSVPDCLFLDASAAVAAAQMSCPPPMNLCP